MLLCIGNRLRKVWYKLTLMELLMRTISWEHQEQRLGMMAGRSLDAISHWYLSLSNALHAQAQACRDRIRMIVDWNADHVIVEIVPSNSSIYDTQEANIGRRLWQSLLKFKSSLLFSRFDIVHARHLANLAAHLSARQPSLNRTSCTWSS